MSHRLPVLLAACAFGAALLVPSTALAQDAPDAPPASAPEPAPAPPEVDPNALDLDAGGGFVIIGKEHLPDFTVLIDRENLSKAYDLQLDERFLSKIVDAVDKAPF